MKINPTKFSVQNYQWPGMAFFFSWVLRILLIIRKRWTNHQERLKGQGPTRRVVLTHTEQIRLTRVRSLWMYLSTWSCPCGRGHGGPTQSMIQGFRLLYGCPCLCYLEGNLSALFILLTNKPINKIHCPFSLLCTFLEFLKPFGGWEYSNSGSLNRRSFWVF